VEQFSLMQNNSTSTVERHWGMAGSIVLAYLVLGLVCGLVVPPFENLDEIEHFEAVRYIADTGRLPTHGTSATRVYRYRQEASQPPLYYILSAGLVRLTGLKADDAAATWRLNPWVACGPGATGLYDNRAVLYHNPNQETFPWSDTLLMLHVLRVWSTLLQAVTVISTYALARRAFPQRRGIGLVAMAIVAFNPQFLLVASGVNNDNLVIPLATVGLYSLLRVWQDGLSMRRAVGLGALTGLAGLSKLSGWGLLGLAGLVTLAMIVRSKRVQTRFILTAILIPITALLLAGWWFWRNWQLYRDITALRPMLELVGARDGALIQPLLEASLMFRSFWGQIPCSFYPQAFYVLYIVLTVLALSGLAWGWRRLTSSERKAEIIFGGWVLLIVASWIRWDVMTPAPGGRLLFPALPAVALLMALGLGELTPRRSRLGNRVVIGLLALAAVWTILQILPDFFAPPSRYPAASDVQPEHPLDAMMGDSIRLSGYDISLDDSDDGEKPILDMTLYWHPLVTLTEDYVLALQLVSPVPGDTTLRWNYNSWPGRGNYPTSAWLPGEVITDRYRFRLTESDLPTQAWDVHVALYQKETGKRLPTQVGGLDAGEQVMLSRLRVSGPVPVCPEEGRLTSDVHFGKAIALTHAWIVPEQEGNRVTLCWKALQSLPDDYTVFVHLEDAAGALVSTGDGPPMRGAFPTSMWQPGDVVLDSHYLTPVLDEAKGERITIGWYKPDDGSRLPASIGDVSIPNASVPVWPDRP
jgi:hypothetical protein